jgi:hypothetical protein
MTYRKGSTQSSLNDSSVASIRLMGMRGISVSELSDAYGVSTKTIYNILNNNTWNHVPSPVRAYGFPDYLILPDGTVYNPISDNFISSRVRLTDGQPVVRIKNSGGKRVTVSVATLVARGYLGSRSSSPNVRYVDGNPRNTHFTNISL